MKIPRTKKGFTLIELLVVIGIIALLASIALPAFSTVQFRAAQTKALSNAKQVGMCCKLYAADNNGAYPSSTFVTATAATPTVEPTSGSSNDCLSDLFPTYVTSVQIFWLAKSAFCQASTPNDPNPNTDTGTAALSSATGRVNEWAYVVGLFDTSNASFPLLADGFVSATAHTYTNVESSEGGVWKGTSCIVVHCDDSAAILKTAGSAPTYTIPGGANATPGTDLFENSSGQWLGASNYVVNPIP